MHKSRNADTISIFAELSSTDKQKRMLDLSSLQSALSCIRNFIIHSIIRILCFLFPSVRAACNRIKQSPGLPLPKPTTSYWLVPPSPISEHGSTPDTKLPVYADVVIIGSGITGTGFARTLLDHDAKHSETDASASLQVVMLEAREVCSGATGRNGGHITPPLYQSYDELMDAHGASTAKKIIKFRHSHIHELITVAEEEGLTGESQCREVDTFEVFHHEKVFADAKQKLSHYLDEIPSQKGAYSIHEDRDVLKSLQLSASTVGCVSTRAGAVHPYRLVTGILARLLDSYPNFRLFAKTPVTNIRAPNLSQPHWYTVVTPRGTINTPHVVHATNGWASHLLPGMRQKIIPTRASMTAQVPPPGLGETPSPKVEKPMSKSWIGQRSFVFFRQPTTTYYDYLTQQLPKDDNSSSAIQGQPQYPHSDGELMFGGGFSGIKSFLTEIGSADDQSVNPTFVEYLRNALDDYFTVHGDALPTGSNYKLTSAWSGVLGMSVDEVPWVGRIPTKVTGRATPSPVDLRATEILAEKDARRKQTPMSAPGEWLAAGYSGEGMVHAWLSARALAYMVLDLDENAQGRSQSDTGLGSWFPDAFRITEERWRKATIENLIASLFH